MKTTYSAVVESGSSDPTYSRYEEREHCGHAHRTRKAQRCGYMQCPKDAEFLADYAETPQRKKMVARCREHFGHHHFVKIWKDGQWITAPYQYTFNGQMGY